MQMIQYRNIQAWKTVLTTVSIGNQFGFDTLSVNALESMNFKVKSTSNNGLLRKVGPLVRVGDA
jgi:hypothetical protein